MAKGKHLTRDERYTIQHGLEQRLSFKEIARRLGKDPSTISKEVRNHLKFERKGGLGRRFNDCRIRKDCTLTHVCRECAHPNLAKRACTFCGCCVDTCRDYEKEVCSRLLRPPYVCNGCPTRSKCSLEKRYYKAGYAQKEYEEVLTEARSGFCITENELKTLNDLLSPLILNGQSIHHICLNHSDEIHYSEKTLYNFTDAGLLTAKNIDMPRKVRFAVKKKKSVEFKVDKKCRITRTYQDYLQYRQEHPDIPVVEIDSVEGIKGGAVLLTIHFVQQKLQLAFRRDANTSRSVTEIFQELRRKLGNEKYKELFPLILADNGSEFSDPKAIEFDEENNRLSHLFYCDPRASFQKGACENNHEMIRRIIPKGKDLTSFSQEQISLMMSHINSYRRPILGNKSPYEQFAFAYGRSVLEVFCIKRIADDEIVLKPELLK